MLTSSSEGPEEEPEMLLEALERLEERTPGRYRLTIVGDGQLENELRAEADRFDDAARFRGHVPNGPELFELYRASDVFVAAITRGASDDDLRAVFRELGLAWARTLTLERQATRDAAYISKSDASEPGSAAEHRLSS